MNICLEKDFLYVCYIDVIPNLARVIPKNILFFELIVVKYLFVRYAC